MNEVFKALAHPARRKILELLKKRDLTAGELADLVGEAPSTMSGHFTVLKNADLIHADRNGTTITYSLNLSVLEEALLAFARAVGVGEGEKESGTWKPEKDLS